MVVFLVATALHTSAAQVTAKGGDLTGRGRPAFGVIPEWISEFSPAEDVKAPQSARSFGITIVGPRLVQVGYECTWYVSISGGTGPYDYLWMGWDFQVAYVSSFTQTVSETGSHALYAEVYDYGGPYWDYEQINVQGTTSPVGCG